MIALQARMQASYQDHVAQTQTLNAKVSCHTKTIVLLVVVVIRLPIRAENAFPFCKKKIKKK